jgi:Ser/Thr protein kinase RdoA (MazF antagonist)
MREIYSEIARRFRLPGKIASVSRTGNGSIHHTYHVTLENGEEYIFQKINTAVFRNPAEIMENIARVTAHIRGKCGERPCLSFLCTESGENYTVIGEEYWRVSPYIDSVTIAPDACLAPEVIRGTGEAFGEFQRQLADFDGSVLHGTIPDFHDTRKRLDTLFADAAAYAGTQSTRISDTVRELARLRAYYKEAIVLSDRYRAGEFPVRVTHNDTKANNVLFDRESLRPLTVIDLDTVMPGMAMYDFGDAVRYLANTAAEDEADLTKVSFDEARFAHFAEGFLGTVRDTLTADEVRNMVRGAFSVTVELAARFLDDYLCGDRYFRVEYAEHNLVRARNQLCLADDIFAKSAKLEKIAEAYVR